MCAPASQPRVSVLLRESLDFDVVIVGAGPAGLAAACRIGQLAAVAGRPLSVGIVEKGAEVGAHIVSGAVIETRALDELFPDWRERGAPVEQVVAEDRVVWLSNERTALRVPHALVPRPLRNEGNYIVSLGRLCRWLAAEAEALGCDILPGFAATEVLCDDAGRVVGVATGDKGIAADGSEKPNAEPGYELRARYVVFAEGCRGSLARTLETRFRLRAGVDPQHYGLGFKEVWEIDPGLSAPGLVEHTIGWPLDDATEGGGFVYHTDGSRLSVGFVVALNYHNPHLSPFDEFQRWKQHPRIRRLLEGGRRIAYGARAVNKGGLPSLPRLHFPGGLLVGCAAGFLNGAKIKGTHTAMKSGMLAAEAIVADLADNAAGGRDLEDYASLFRDSWLHAELYAARNFSAGIARFGTLVGGALAFFEHNVLRGHSPLQLRNGAADHSVLQPADSAPRMDYPKPDGVVSFDRLSSVHLSNVEHDDDQPCHLVLADPDVPLRDNLPRFYEPAQRYCPAAVYEVVTVADEPRFRINAGNCIHCKTCDIKDPAQNITWRPPEGGSGPNYGEL